MSHSDEYTTPMLAAMDLIWGEGFMAPGGAGNVDNLVAGIDLHGRRVLDIGCGQGLPACILASRYNASVIGTDLEAHLIKRAQARSHSCGLAECVSFVLVEPGPLSFADASFDMVICSGAMTQVEDKLSMYRECLRVLKPRGTLSCYDWMKPLGPISADMRYWFELEGLSYALRTPDEHIALLTQAGFVAADYRDKSAWYRCESAMEHARMAGELRPALLNLLGEEEADHFTEAWRMLALLCEKGELLQVYTRARRPG